MQRSCDVEENQTEIFSFIQTIQEKKAICMDFAQLSTLNLLCNLCNIMVLFFYRCVVH